MIDAQRLYRSLKIIGNEAHLIEFDLYFTSENPIQKADVISRIEPLFNDIEMLAQPKVNKGLAAVIHDFLRFALPSDSNPDERGQAVAYMAENQTFRRVLLTRYLSSKSVMVGPPDSSVIN